MTENIVALQFADNDTTYRAQSDLLNSELGGSVVSSAIVSKDAAGNVTIPQGDDSAAGAGTATGSLVGILVGILGGPLGVLLGWGTGAVIGAAADADRGDDADTALDLVGGTLLPGRNVLIVEIEETTNDALDAFAANNGATLLRKSADEVSAEVDAAQDALAQARSAAREQLRDQHKAERKAEREARKAEREAKREARHNG